MSDAVYNVYVTLLPNGVNADKTLRFSVALTPSLPTGLKVPPPFDAWPVPARALLQAPQPGKPETAWHLMINGKQTPSSLPLLPLSHTDQNPKYPDLSPELWSALVDDTLAVKARSEHKKYKSAWFITPQSTALNQRQSTYRAASVSRQLSNSLPAHDHPMTSVVDDNAPVTLYIYPQTPETVPGAVANSVADRQLAQKVLTNYAATPAANQKMILRIQHGIRRLENETGESLAGHALLAIYNHCLQAFSKTEQTFATTVTTTYGKLSSAPATLEVVTRYVEYHLFRNKKSKKGDDCPAQKPPDFHQILGLLQKYPYLMRPLGLIFDFDKVSLPPFVFTTPNIISIQPPAISGPGYRINFLPVSSAFNDLNSFQMLSRDQTHVARCLKLSASGFELFSEDVDGTSQKHTNQAAASKRRTEYTTTAPKTVTSGIPSPDPTTETPSGRTAGLGLYWNGRAAFLSQTIAASPDPNGTPSPASPIYLEDVTLGYRTDISTDGKTWNSLHLRTSVYTVNKKPFAPADSSCAAVDEGYIGLAATHSQVDDAANDTQVHLHESMLVWTGWSLSVQRPGITSAADTTNGTPTPPCTSGTLPSLPLQITTNIVKGSLPKLRFNSQYSMRLRHVDIAGNSLLNTDPADQATVRAMKHAFRRSEPFRAPQIVLEKVIDRVRSPGEQANLMVLRDNDGEIRRRLIPSREPLRMAELSSKLDKGLPGEGAFGQYRLMPNGSFPSVLDACKHSWLEDHVCSELSDNDTEKADALLLRSPDKSVPKVPFYPDPQVNYVRIRPLVLQADLSSYVPWLEDGDARPDTPDKSLATYYAQLYPFLPWPNATTVRVLVRGVGAEKPLRIDLDFLAEGEIGTLPTLPTLTVDLPQASTVALQLSSSTNVPKNPPAGLESMLARWVASAKPALVQTTLESVAPAEAIPQVASEILVLQPWTYPNLAGELAHFADQTTLATKLCDGSVSAHCPTQTLTLVHAVKKPLKTPEFVKQCDTTEFTSVRQTKGSASAVINAGVTAHWLSTAKVTCHASWTDRIDDPRRSAPEARASAEVAFEYVNQNGAEEKEKFDRSPRNIGGVHALRDTRAHSITYSLSAFTRFSEYYPSGQDGSIAGETPCTFDVLSSLRPPAPVVSYILPAFLWQDTYHAKSKSPQRGRTMVLRVYLERPFLVSGDGECLGVVLASSTKSSQVTPSRWGTDPVMNNDLPLQKSAMTEQNFVHDKTQWHQDCAAMEDNGDNKCGVDVISFAVDFNPDRGLWYCDIPLAASQTSSAIAQLALVRWQPDARVAADDDARLSQVVLADFIQIRPDRWVSVQKIDAKTYKICVSGAFRNPHNDPLWTADTAAGVDPAKVHPMITCSVEQRWHRLGEDFGWRPICAGPVFAYTPPGTNETISVWTGTVELPHSSTFYNFRLLLEEREWFLADKEKTTKPTAGQDPETEPKSRVVYMHYVAL